MSHAISIHHISKRYLIDRVRRKYSSQYHTLQEAVLSAAAAPWRMFRRGVDPSPRREEFWALRDVSFDVEANDVIGIIGRNGAGKSTLLKILTRITEPTSGHVKLRGRVGSLLEVGTGFHPELTGRENIFLNGSILGMSRREIKRQFDEIVDFSGVERFLDTPVKRYSSGMRVRLAFSVAAHLQPEILLIDEVLAVGDAEFQKKCLGKMGELAHSGRTVLFVSHSMAAIERLCNKVVVLDVGSIAYAGDVPGGIAAYLQTSLTPAMQWTRQTPALDVPHFLRAWICHPDGSPCGYPTSASTFGVAMEICLPAPVKDLLLGLVVYNELMHPLFATNPVDCHLAAPESAGTYLAQVIFPSAIFVPKQYVVQLVMYTYGQLFDSHLNALTFDVAPAASIANNLPGGRAGDLQILCDWGEFKPLPAG